MTVVYVDLAVHALGATGAGALVGVDEINAGASILAWAGLAFVYLLGAVDSLVPRHALTRVATGVVSAGGAIVAWAG